MNFGQKIIIIPILLLILSYGGLIAHAQDYTPDEYYYYEEVYLDEWNQKVQFFIVENEKYMPCPKDPGFMNIGCSIHFENKFAKDWVFVMIYDHIDIFGFSNVTHEFLHVICDCNFHRTDKLSQKLIDSGNPWKYAIENQFEIRILEASLSR